MGVEWMGGVDNDAGCGTDASPKAEGGGGVEEEWWVEDFVVVSCSIARVDCHGRTVWCWFTVTVTAAWPSCGHGHGRGAGDW